MQFASRSEKLKTEGKISHLSFRNTVYCIHLYTYIYLEAALLVTELEIDITVILLNS